MAEAPIHDTFVDGDRTIRVLWWVALGVLLTATGALFFLWPIRHVLGDVVLGSAVFSPDAVLNLGILEWGYTSLRSPGLRLFEWTAGFPMHNTLAATENLLGWQLFYAPLRSSGLGPVAAYNALMFATVPVSGLTAALLARQLGASRAGALVSGFAFAFAPLYVTQMVHIQIRAMCWAPLPFIFLDRVLLHGRWRDAGGLTLAFLLIFASSVYVGVFIALGLILYLAASWMAGHSRVTASCTLSL